MKELKVAIIGATGVVGQQFVVALDKHPWFNISFLAASEKSAGKTYGEALMDEKTGGIRWYCDEPVPQNVLNMNVVNSTEIDTLKVDIIFSAVESDLARKLEPLYAKTTAVVSTAAAFRYDDDVPILVPGVNSEHAEMVTIQRKNRDWKGFIAPGPNCTTTGLVVTLKPLQKFGLEKVVMTSMQALSGAGRSPPVAGLDIIDNVIPFIPREEEKVQKETVKILGRYDGEKIIPAEIEVSCTCTRVNVKDGHTEAVFVYTNEKCDVGQIKEAMKSFSGVLKASELPSAPEEMLILHENPFRPQPRLDRDSYGGMATAIGRIREDKIFGNGVKYVLVSHNTKIGAAKGALLIAELLTKKGLIRA